MWGSCPCWLGLFLYYLSKGRGRSGPYSLTLWLCKLCFGWCLLVTETLIMIEEFLFNLSFGGKRSFFMGCRCLQSYGFYGVSKIEEYLGEWIGILWMFGPSFVFKFLYRLWSWWFSVIILNEFSYFIICFYFILFMLWVMWSEETISTTVGSTVIGG